MGLPAFWTVEGRVDAARALRAKGLRGKALAAELTALWGVPVSSDAVTSALRRGSARSARPPPAQAEPPPAEDVEVVEEFLLSDDMLAPDQEPVAEEPFTEPPASFFAHTSRTRGEARLYIPDTQEPYSAPGAVAFVAAVAREFGVNVREPGNVYHVGDEADLYCFTKFLRSPEAPHTTGQELEALRDRMREWYSAFPFVRVCKSNHVDRMMKRAAEAGLPTQVLRSWRELVGAPDGWEWGDSWRVEGSRADVLVEHGHYGPQGVNAARMRALSHGMNVVFGHQVQAQIVPVRTHRQSLWAMCTGALIDRDAVAFEYGKSMAFQPVNGCGVSLDGGRVPIWIPYGGSWP